MKKTKPHPIHTEWERPVPPEMSPPLTRPEVALRVFIAVTAHGTLVLTRGLNEPLESAVIICATFGVTAAAAWSLLAYVFGGELDKIVWRALLVMWLASLYFLIP